MSWIVSTSCSGPLATLSSSSSTFTKAQEWLAYIFFAQCPQHSIVAVLGIGFLAAAIASIFFTPKLSVSSSSIKAPASFYCVVASSTVLTITSLAIAIYYGAWLSSARETALLAIDAAAWLGCLVIVLQQKRYGSAKYPNFLRSWWFISFILCVLQFMSSIFRLIYASGLSYDLLLEVTDIYAFPKFAIAAFLLKVTINGKTGFSYVEQSSIKEPLLPTSDGAIKDVAGASPLTSGFAKASIFSKATFTWLTPLLWAGSKRSLQIGDVPPLAPTDSAESMFNFLQSKLPSDSSHHRPLTVALLKCFWPKLLLTGSLQLLRTCFIYVGPLLISSFTNYANGQRASLYDGYVLVILLLSAKMVELFSYHQYNFQCYKLGNNLRTAVVTILYRKGLRLSSSARQTHGVGQITNYMVVDAQQLSDACLQMHFCWSLPLQVVIALVLLYQCVGISALAGIATMVIVTLFTVYNTKQQKFFQGFVMRLRDTRMKAITEVLAYMKVIKLQAWEDKFRDNVEKCRQNEFDWLTKFVMVTAVNMFTMWNTLPFVSVFTYCTAILLDAGLTTAKVFTAASIFRIVQEPIRNFPQAVIALSQLAVSLERLDRYLLSPELEEGAVIKLEDVDERPVVVQNGCFTWEEKQKIPTLRNINLDIRRGSLVTIVGTVGSGKSSLLSALLGEMMKLSGTAKTAGSIAYVAQTSWIQNATIQDNILFGSELNPVRYQEVLQACSLEPDLASMDFGDQTEIGEKGINLSGGQKQRIQLARAIYQNCDVYLLDDVFSAVDAHTGSHLFKECIRGLLKEKTILLVTHQVEFLTGADLVVVMKEGEIVQAGRYGEILNAGTDFAALVAAHNESMDKVDRGSAKEDGKEHGLSESLSKDSTTIPLRGMSERSISSAASDKLPSSDSFAEVRLQEGTARLIEEEQREKGRVSWQVYWLYLTKAFGWSVVAILALNQAIWQACLLGTDYWLADEIPSTEGGQIKKGRFILVYVILNVAAIVGILVRVIVVATFGLKTAQMFFLEMLRSIFRAPMAFFDTTPSGRIISRFTADQTNIDFLLHFFLGGLMSTYFTLLGVIIVVSISTWPIVLLIIPLGWVYYWCQQFYITSSREMTRLDSITKAPLIYHFSETVAGIETIRCFKKQAAFAQQNVDRVNMNMRMDFHNNTANEWLGLRLEAIGTTILCTVALLFVVLPENLIDPDTVGLALSYALSLNGCLYWSVWLTCTVENKMVSVERIRQFTVIPSEAAYTIPDSLPSTSWPTVGQIISKRLKLRYRPNTPLVLKGVSFTIEGGEKVGVVGRTGSGKSTLILALFRLVEPAAGQILIDNVDISTIGLYELRSSLGIIPQDPVLFEGTVRLNLDPLGIYTDEEIWMALEKCQLANVIQEKPEKLDASVTEYGGNWSVGQRQLLCFGRALLKRSKLLFLDEATASVDTQTDVTIQRIVREEFEGSTVVSIAHRIPTVMDSDKVLVMEDGRVKEYDSPAKLLQNPASVFASLVHEYSSRSGD